jgi:thioesterase domain-containing protein
VDDIGVPSAASTLGWRQFGGSVSVDLVPGNHITMMSDPHVSSLAAALQQRLG